MLPAARGDEGDPPAQYGATFWVDPEARRSVVIMTNTAGPVAMGFAAEMEQAVYGRAAGQGE